MGWQQPLKPGDRFPIALTFEHRAPVTVEATVDADHAH
jgi:copper(I)-binding protein